MTKKEFIAKLAGQTGMTHTQSETAFNAVLSIIGNTLAKGEEVTLPEIGKFFVRETPARVGFNPKTREKIDVPAKNEVKFKASTVLKGRINA